jgi:hypothetical protein
MVGNPKAEIMTGYSGYEPLRGSDTKEEALAGSDSEACHARKVGRVVTSYHSARLIREKTVRMV